MNCKLKNLFFLFLIQLLFSNDAKAQDNDRYLTAARLYDSKIGKFIQADPVIADPKSARGINHYAYVYNNPLKFVDPTGNTPNLPNNSNSSLELLKEIDSTDQSFLNIRLDFDVQGNPIDQSSEPVRVEEDGSLVDPGRIVQGATFGTREALRLGLAPVNELGKVADVLIVPASDAERLAMQKLLALNQGVDLDELADGIRIIRGLDVAEDSVGQILTKAINQKHFRTLELIGMDQLSNASLSQTPVFAPILDQRWMAHSTYIRSGLKNGAYFPSAMSLGGVFGIYSGLQSESAVAQSLGISGGTLEVLGGIKYFRSARIIGSASFSGGSTGISATFSAMTAVRLMRVGGLLGLVAAAAEITYQGDGFEKPIPKYSREKAIDMRMNVQEVSNENQHKYSTSVK